MTFEEARRHSLDQLRLLIEAADRREAKRVLMQMHATAAAIALCFGEKGPAKELSKELAKLAKLK